MPAPRLDIATPVAEDEGIEETDVRALPTGNAPVFTRQPAPAPAGAAEPCALEAESPPQPAASPPRTESVPAPPRETVTSARVERASPEQANVAPDQQEHPSAESVEYGRRARVRSIAEPDSERGEQSQPASAPLPPPIRAEARREHESRPSDPRVVPPVSPPNVDVKDAPVEDRKLAANLIAANRVPPRQAPIERALRASHAEASPKPSEPPRRTESESGIKSTIEATVTTPLRKPSAAMREPVRSRVSVPLRRDHEIAERPNAPDPIIQVTIGRVEVRASTLSEPRAKPRPANGATGLDEYLRQRAVRGSS
jgi:hypothetical protein